MGLSMQFLGALSEVERCVNLMCDLLDAHPPEVRWASTRCKKLADVHLHERPARGEGALCASLPAVLNLLVPGKPLDPMLAPTVAKHYARQQLKPTNEADITQFLLKETAERRKHSIFSTDPGHRPYDPIYTCIECDKVWRSPLSLDSIVPACPTCHGTRIAIAA